MREVEVFLRRWLVTGLRSKTRVGIISAKRREKEGEERRGGTLWDRELSGHVDVLDLKCQPPRRG